MKTDILNAKTVSKQDVGAMLQLMEQHYENVSPTAFESDLRRKDIVAVFRDNGNIRGFSTLALVHDVVDAQPVRVFFSGDTVMCQAFRNSVALPFAISRAMLAELDRNPSIPLYWLLTSKGYKTFHFLPLFFKDFFPWIDRALSDFEAGVLTAACERLFNGRLDRSRWILKAAESDQRLRHGVADIDARVRRRPDTAYFEKINPGHARGDELVCLARFSRENLRPSMLRKLSTP